MSALEIQGGADKANIALRLYEVQLFHYIQDFRHFVGEQSISVIVMTLTVGTS